MSRSVPPNWRRLSGIGALTLIGVVCFGGCDFVPSSGRPYDHVNITVVDGETRQPIGRVHVETHKGEARGDSTTTDANGRCRLRIGRHVNRGILVTAAGYMLSPYYTHVASRTAYVLPLYRPPEPLAGVTIPISFRGVLRVKNGGEPISPPLPANWPAGQREFYTPANVDGVTTIQPPPHLSINQASSTQLWVARFEDGTPLRFENPIALEYRPGPGHNEYLLPDVREMAPHRKDGVSLFDLGEKVELATSTGYHVFCVGTREEARVAQASLIKGATSVKESWHNRNGYLFEPMQLEVDDMATSAGWSPRKSK